MGRPKRADQAGCIYHMLNRANDRRTIFHKSGDYEAFERVIREALDQFDVRFFSYCVLPNHWHMAVSPGRDGEMGRFGGWIGLTHTQRHHAHYDCVGDGHLYQGRFKSFPVQDDDHFLSVCRYVERNALSAGLCSQPDRWRYGSLWRWSHGNQLEKSLLSPWPIARRENWVQCVATPLSAREQKRLRLCVRRGCPFGDECWTEATARHLGLESTMRPRGRPRKLPS